MTITLPSTLSEAITASAAQRGVTPEALAVDTLAKSFGSIGSQPVKDVNEFIRQLAAMAIPAGVSLSDRDVSSEGIYD